MDGRLSLSCNCGDCDGGICSSIWSNLPIDLIIEVLCRLPDKPLIQFKSVSNAWNSFITQVCVPRLTSSAPISSLIFRLYSVVECYGVITSQGQRDTEILTSCIETLPFQGVWQLCIDIIGCFDGLVLVSRRVRPKEFYVCNPVTRQCVSVPVNPKHRTNSLMGLAFNPKNNTYKIVRVARSSDNLGILPILDVFSSVTAEWRSYEIPLERRIISCKWLSRLVYLNENVYALSSSRHLMCFDLRSLDDEKLSASAIELPVKTSRGDDRHLGLISLSNECLYYSRVDESVLRIWSLEVGRSKATSVWFLAHSISLDKLRQLPCGKHLSPSSVPFVINPASGVIYLGSAHVVFKYNLWTSKLELFHQMKVDEKILNGTICFHSYRRNPVMIPDRKC